MPSKIWGLRMYLPNSGNLYDTQGWFPLENMSTENKNNYFSHGRPEESASRRGAVFFPLKLGYEFAILKFCIYKFLER